MEMRCYCKILCISYKDHVTNKEVRAKIQQAIGPHEDLTIVKMQAAVVWLCLPFIRSGQNHLARHSERGKKTKQTEEEVGRQHQGMDRPGVRQVPEGSGEQGKMEETGCKIICGAPTTLAVEIYHDDEEEIQHQRQPYLSHQISLSQGHQCSPLAWRVCNDDGCIVLVCP